MHSTWSTEVRVLAFVGGQCVLRAFLRRDTLFDEVAEDRLRVAGVDSDPARDFARLGARVRLQVGDHFAALGAARGAFTAGAVRAFDGLRAFPSSGNFAAGLFQGAVLGGSVQVCERAFELAFCSPSVAMCSSIRRWASSGSGMCRVPFGELQREGIGKPMEEGHQVLKTVGLQRMLRCFQNVSTGGSDVG